MGLDQEIVPEIKKYWFEGILHEKLCSRKKGQHLKADHKDYICSLLKEFPENQKSIKDAYRLSSATYNRLKNTIYSPFRERDWKSKSNLMKNFISPDIQGFIAEMISPPQLPMTIKRIRNAVYDKFGKTYSPHIMNKFLKKVLNFSFKKSWSRPPKYMTSKTITAKGVFWIELLKSIYKQQVIFSVDEWSFTRAVKAEYSWLPVGKSSVVTNMTFIIKQFKNNNFTSQSSLTSNQ